jgi:hypothetical protein
MKSFYKSGKGRGDEKQTKSKKSDVRSDRDAAAPLPGNFY